MKATVEDTNNVRKIHGCDSAIVRPRTSAATM